jgi:hypothetical protein
VDAAELLRHLESFVVARWGKDMTHRPRSSCQTRPWGIGETPEKFNGLTWLTFGDTLDPKAVGIRMDGSHGSVPAFLLVYWRRSGKIESYLWRYGPGSGWHYVAQR